MRARSAKRSFLAVMAVMAATVTMSGCTYKKGEPMETRGIAQGTAPPVEVAFDPALWGKLYPIHYRQWKLTSEPTPAGLSKYKRGYDVGEERRDKLDEYPFLALLYHGWGFGSEYKEPRGHYYMVQDQLEVDPGRLKAGGACLTCKTPYSPLLREQMGGAYFSTPYKEVLGKLPKDKQALGVSCVDCHDYQGMKLRYAREFTLGKALEKIGVDKEKLGRDKMRTLVCAQCHVTYMIPKDKEMKSVDVVFPWGGSREGAITIENIIRQIRSTPANVEWTQSVTGFKLGFIRHPEYELYSNQSTHWQQGVTCADCHMPVMRESGQELTDHRIMSPLKGDMSVCAGCHTETPEQLRAKVIRIQDTFMVNYLKTGYDTATVAKLFEIANKARGAGRRIGDEAYGSAREHFEQAFYRLVFVGAENSTGFHNPQEAMRVIADAAKHAEAAEKELRQALAKAGEKVPEEIDLELSKYTTDRGVKKLKPRPEHEIKPPVFK